MKRLRVLVCGSNYGRVYFEALRRRPDRFQPAGLLARGSGRSRELAAAAGVPMYRAAGELPPDIDLACAAVGTAAGQIVVELLGRGVHVLCEHPQPGEFLERAFEAATASGAVFHLNAHFGLLPAARAWIREGRRRIQAERPLFLTTMATDRSLYSLLDMLGQALGGVAMSGFDHAEPAGPLALLHGELGGVPAAFAIQAGSSSGERLPDGSPQYVLDHRAALGFSEGILTLLSIAGPVVWNSSLSRALSGPVWHPVPVGADVTARSLGEARVLANLEAVEVLAAHATGGKAPQWQSPEHILAVSRAWERISAALGRCGRRQGRARKGVQ